LFEAEVEIIEVRCDPFVAHRRGKHGTPLETVLRQHKRLRWEPLPFQWKVTVKET
jgi:hypothetical protein